MGSTLAYINSIFIRKYRNRFHVWIQPDMESDLFFFINMLKATFDEYEEMNPHIKSKKLITWEE